MIPMTKVEDRMRELEYYWKIIRDTADVEKDGFRINPAGAGELQKCIMESVHLIAEMQNEISEQLKEIEELKLKQKTAKKAKKEKGETEE